ncbi:O-methyltransferase [Paenibacillus urinalis]|uniref:O-methyltransferase n=1 Tax=Paenibacillus urinalis TaxID=521520 RepID=A0AAX3MX42_9BACL|nr:MULTISPECIES: O-methyltransferase [Paenibacillus]WDH81691.1 O-methyltransferase [Paenibacillus urinalis]WDH97735.1 O-methyltransferase [Paenibacillus urinalis]WDI01411.1 O-methyltransferase [Paenibacillus urinalis]GAK42193.1 O-methyltransferase family 5 [Paenibacillus sp. TCA20]
MNQMNTWSQVDRYVEDKLIPRDPLLEAVLTNNQQSNLPPIDVAPNQGKLLQLLLQIQKGKRVLEIGTLGAYSTIWMARALPDDGRLITLELDPHHADIAHRNLELAGLDHLVEIRVGDALLQLEKMKNEEEEPFDFIFIDADKPNNPAYIKYALELSHTGTVIIGDNVIREGEITNHHSTDPRIQGVRQFYDILSNETQISATAIQTVGSKGYDGFVIGIVN